MASKWLKIMRQLWAEKAQCDTHWSNRKTNNRLETFLCYSNRKGIQDLVGFSQRPVGKWKQRKVLVGCFCLVFLWCAFGVWLLLQLWPPAHLHLLFLFLVGSMCLLLTLFQYSSRAKSMYLLFEYYGPLAARHFYVKWYDLRSKKWLRLSERKRYSALC